MERTNRKIKLQMSIMLAMLITTQWVLAAEKQLIIIYKDKAPLITALSAQTASQQKQTMQAAATQFSQIVDKPVSYVRSLAVKNTYIFKVDDSNDNNISTVIQQLSANPKVESVEEDKLLQAFFTPNDALYPDQWQYHDSAGGLNLPNAWDQATGSGVVVAVIDSGYRPHVDLIPNLLPGYDMISNIDLADDGDLRDNNARDPGTGFSEGECGERPAEKSSWHGTHIAGTIAAITNNNIGVAGVAFNAQILPVRVLGKCGALTSDILEAIIWAVGVDIPEIPENKNPAQVINLSLGGPGECGAAMQTAIDIARDNGATVVVAAGNASFDANEFIPGNCAGVINVAATDINGGAAFYSNTGTMVDVSAPGGTILTAEDPSGILSTTNSGTADPVADNYGYLQGTSFATPHVAGVAALLYQTHPGITPDEVETLLKNNTRPLTDGCLFCGTGIVDATATINATLVADEALKNGRKKRKLSSTAGKTIFFTFDVPKNAVSLRIKLSDGNEEGDADLYVRHESRPTKSRYDCRSNDDGNNEVCRFINPQSGTWRIMIDAYDDYSDVSLIARYVSPARKPKKPTR